MDIENVRMVDVYEAEVVEITISPKGTVWVNIDGICCFRSTKGIHQKQQSIVINDQRK